MIAGKLVCREQCTNGPFGPGAMLGLLELLSERAYVHTPIANTVCVLLRLPLDGLLAALDTHRDLAMQLDARLARDLWPAASAAIAA